MTLKSKINKFIKSYAAAFFLVILMLFTLRFPLVVVIGSDEMTDMDVVVGEKNDIEITFQQGFSVSYFKWKNYYIFVACHVYLHS